ncbi:MAG: hypothetical protein QM817_00185 [Archangium sp.]
MSDDEVARRRAPGLAVIALVVLVAGALFMRSRILERYASFAAFCNATHPGEEWSHVQSRASAQDWAWVKQSPSEFLVEFEEWTYRAGCLVTLDGKQRVVRTRLAGTLPSR